MTEPATVDSSVEEQKPGFSCTHPLALDAIWSNICTHLTTNEWLQVAWTCKASRDVQLQQAVLNKDTPVADYSFVLERCQAASSIDVTTEERRASTALKEVLKPGSVLRSVQHLKVTDGWGISLGTYIYRACPNLQVLSLTTEHISLRARVGGSLPPIRHLHLETNITYLLEHSDMQAFTQLETLSLHSWKSWPYFVNNLELDVSSARNLRRLQIESWSPKRLKVAAGCRVHAAWRAAATAEAEEKARVHQWLHSPCWRAPGTKLAALRIEHNCLIWPDAVQLSAIRAILECQHELEILHIAVVRLGSPEKLLNTLFPYFKGMKTPLRVDISTSAGCHLYLDDTLCLSKTLVPNIDGPVLLPVQAASGKVSLDVLHGYSVSAEKGPSITREQLARNLSRFKMRQIF